MCDFEYGPATSDEERDPAERVPGPMTPPVVDDDDEDALAANVGLFRGPAVALPGAARPGLEVRVAARVTRHPVLALVSNEPATGAATVGLPLGVAAPAGRFACLRVTSLEPPFEQRLRPTPLVAPTGGCRGGFLTRGTCRPPDMDYFALPAETAGFLAGTPRGARLALVLGGGDDGPAPWVPDLDPWQAEGVCVHGLSRWPGLAAEPDLCLPPGSDDGDGVYRARPPAPAPACCWLGAAVGHAEAVLGERCLRPLTAAETATVEDQLAVIARALRPPAGASPAEG